MTGADITPLGDAALVVRSPLARELMADLTARPLPGVREAVPALDVLTVLYDPLTTSAEDLGAGLTARLADLRPARAGDARTHVLPVTFGGPDLAWCATHAGLSVTDFVQAMCEAKLTVAFLGFTPGFAFLTGLPEPLRMPRLDAPRERVPAGSVALGGPWAGVYPRETPGGWRIVGRTEAVLFDLQRPEPLLWRAGDRVRFEVQR
ncbi:allophanate hydrolase subunit 1 [Deinococcus aluminii]|uniref:5-oxoprolinase subunit B n=1 Tax=Deinococcus aluminii TaxID=1656885 RepID=A0ABP9XBH3_9DEIO